MYDVIFLDGENSLKVHLSVPH